jgi:hypothetical protein
MQQRSCSQISRSVGCDCGAPNGGLATRTNSSDAGADDLDQANDDIEQAQNDIDDARGRLDELEDDADDE